MTFDTLHLTFVLPVHDETVKINNTVLKILKYASDHKINLKIILSENGSRDHSRKICSDLAKKHQNVSSVYSDVAGLGLALKNGIFATSEDKMENSWIVLTASDLPFGFTDIEHLQNNQDIKSDIIVGSKSHPQSKVKTTPFRRVLSACYNFIKKLLLNLPIKDSQGSIIIKSNYAKKVAQLVENDKFFFSTEFIFWAHQQGLRINEVPVIYSEEKSRKSTVNPIIDGYKMLKAMIKLRFTYKKTLREQGITYDLQTQKSRH